MRPLGIERQTLAVAIIPVLILAVLLESHFTVARFADLDRALFERAKLMIRQLALVSEYPVFSGNLGALRQQVDIAFSQQDVSSIIVLDADAKYLTGAGGTRNIYEQKLFESLPVKAGDLALFHEDHDAFWIYSPILATQIELDDMGGGAMPGKPMGSVILEIDKSRLNSEKAKMLGLDVLLLMGILLASVMIAMRVSRRITQPVKEMNQAVHRIGQGQMDTYIAESQVLELNELAAGINDMAHQLQKERESLQQRIESATQELRHQKDAAEKANADKSRFLAAASHDLRQPMHALGLFVGELHGRLTTPEQQKVVAKVEESVEAMSSLLDSLLDISKLDAGVVVPQIQQFEIGTIIERLVQDFASLAQSKNISLHAHCVPSRVLSDPLLLERILLNLLGNAMRYTAPGGRVLLACRIRGDYLRIEVRDNGSGIPREEQQNIFREFVQLQNMARDRSKGLGLGLAIVERLARLMHHPLDLRSAPHRGSTFAIMLPRISGVQEMKGEEAPDAVAVKPGRERLEGLKVLVVDDDMLVRTSTAGILESWGCRVSFAESLQEVNDKYSNQCFDLVICDYRLPDGIGLQLADRIESCDTPPAFILISGDTTPGILQAASQRGLHLLHKPVRPAKLRSLILFLLKQR